MGPITPAGLLLGAVGGIVLAGVILFALGMGLQNRQNRQNRGDE